MRDKRPRTSPADGEADGIIEGRNAVLEALRRDREMASGS